MPGILSSAALELLGGYEVEWLGEKIDLTPGWRRLTMVDAVKEYAGIDFGAISDNAQAVAAAEAIGVELPEAADPLGATRCTPALTSVWRKSSFSPHSSQCIRWRYLL